MTEVLICSICGKEGVLHEFIKHPKDICKDCYYTKNMNEREKEIYFIKKESRIRDKIKRLYNKKHPKYSLYSHKLTIDDSPVCLPGNILWIKCAYCGRYYIPTINQVRNRIHALIGLGTGENRFYCSNGCKKACPIFNRNLFPKGFKKCSSREVQPELRQLRLETDNYTCQKCGAGINNTELHCHHITGVIQNPIESADIDNTITLCKDCHKFVHSQKGCNYFELRCS